MSQQHPIPSPPPELVVQWRKSGPADAAVNNAYERHIATQAARWGADQEMEACCEWLDRRLFGRDEIRELRTDRRPKPPSLKEQALEALERRKFIMNVEDLDLLRRALEALPND
tara:strand:- start:15196 stop:15537 length:342 start_codon:yes stop_codon:yes gene_type:complete